MLPTGSTVEVSQLSSGKSVCRVSFLRKDGSTVVLELPPEEAQNMWSALSSREVNTQDTIR